MTELQLELDDQFRREGLLALLGMGSAPGKTNLMGRMAADELRDPAAPGRGAEEAAGIGSVDAVHVSAGRAGPRPAAGFSVPYALQTLLDELTMKPVVLRDGSPSEIEPIVRWRYGGLRRADRGG